MLLNWWGTSGRFVDTREGIVALHVSLPDICKISQNVWRQITDLDHKSPLSETCASMFGSHIQTLVCMQMCKPRGVTQTLDLWYAPKRSKCLLQSQRATMEYKPKKKREKRKTTCLRNTKAKNGPYSNGAAGVFWRSGSVIHPVCFKWVALVICDR